MRAERIHTLPEPWFARHYPGRDQPYTLQRRHNFTRQQRWAYKTWYFAKTFRELETLVEKLEA